MASPNDDRYAKEEHRPTSEDTPMGKYVSEHPEKPKSSPAANPSFFSRAVHHVENTASGGAIDTVKGALDHF